MCGIVGLITLNKTAGYQARRTWFEKALYVDTMRGKDSTGIACIYHPDEEKEVLVHKKAMNGNDFLDLKSTDGILYNMDKMSAIIGHNRWATVGGVNAMTAHPFQHGNITMVHNGTMDYWTGLDKDFDVDSEAICDFLSKEEPKKVLETLDGAFALVWHDALDNTMHFARNTERPFKFAFSKDKKTMLFASEAWMISELAPASLLMEEKVWSLNAGHHLTINLDTATDLSAYTSEEFKPVPAATAYWSKWDKYDVKKQKGRKTTLPITTTITPDSTTAGNTNTHARLKALGYTVGMWVNFYPTVFKPYSTPQKGSLLGTITWGSSQKSARDSIVSYGCSSHFNNCNYLLKGKVMGIDNRNGETSIILSEIDYAFGTTTTNVDDKANGYADYEEDSIVDAFGQDISQEEFDKLAKEGCAICSKDIEAADSEFIDWTDMGKPICLDCTNDAENATLTGDI